MSSESQEHRLVKGGGFELSMEKKLTDSTEKGEIELEIAEKAVRVIAITAGSGAGGVGAAGAGAATGFLVAGPVGAAVGFLLGLGGGTAAGYRLTNKMLDSSD